MYRPTFGLFSCACFYFIGQCSIASAQTLPRKVIQPIESYASQKNAEEVVVTGTRTEKLLTESPVKIDVVTSLELEQITLGTMEQALAFMPGVYISRSQKEGFNILLQGFDGDRVLVLIDGLRVISPTGASADFAQISALNIERIEILRGASSALYGSEAFGGVINIITTKKVRNSFKASYEIGEYTENKTDENDEQVNLLGALSLEKIGLNNWGIEASYQDIDEPPFSFRKNNRSQLAAEQEKSISSIRLMYLTENLNGSYKLQKFDEYKKRITGKFPNGAENFYLSDVEQTTHSLTTQYQDLSIKAQLNQHEETSGNRGSLRFADIEMLEIDSQYNWQSDSIEWIAGAHFYEDSIFQHKPLDNVIEVDESQNGIEIFTQADWQATESLEIVGGLRFQDDEGYGNHSAFKVSSMLESSFSKERKLQWRMSIGDAYRVPTIKEQHYTFDHSNLGYMVLGNSDLAPEEAISFNSSLEWSDSNIGIGQFSSSANVHYTKSKNFIDTLLNPEQSAQQRLQIFEYQNFEEIEISGFDLEASLKQKNNRYRLSYNYLHAIDAITKRRLQDRPYHQIKGNASYSIPGLGLNFLAYFTFQKNEQAPARLQPVTDKTLTFNLSMTHHLNNAFSWRITTENIFNDHRKKDLDFRQEFDPRSEKGRYISISLNYQI